MKKKTWIDPIPTFVALALAASAGLICMLLIGISESFNGIAEFFLWLPLILAPSILALVVVTVLRPLLNVEPTKFYAISSAVFVIGMMAGIFLWAGISTAAYLMNMAAFVVMAAITAYTVRKQR